MLQIVCIDQGVSRCKLHHLEHQSVYIMTSKCHSSINDSDVIRPLPRKLYLQLDMKAKELITWKKIYGCWLLEIVSKPYILDFYLLVTLMKNYTDLSIVCLTTQNNKDICSFWPHDDFNGIIVPIIFFWMWFMRLLMSTLSLKVMLTRLKVEENVFLGFMWTTMKGMYCSTITYTWSIVVVVK